MNCVMKLKRKQKKNKKQTKQKNFLLELFHLLSYE